MRIGLVGRMLTTCTLIVCAATIQSARASAETAVVAVAANFIEALNALAGPFRAETGHELKISSGSTGQLYAQIKHGAPFDVFLSADEEAPRLLEEDGVAVFGSRMTYAVGQLVFWQNDPGWQVTTPDHISRNPVRTVAIANPKLAPYGRAAMQVIDQRPIWYPTKARLVYGQNIAQTYAMVASGNADAGFVARSQVAAKLLEAGGNAKAFVLGMTLIDPKLHDPIRQDAVLLKRAQMNAAATAFMSYLKSPAALKIIAGFGYLNGDR